MISEPFKSDDGRFWVRTDSGETLNFSTSEEAYHFYHRLLEIQERMDRAGTAPTTPLLKLKTPLPVKGVEVGPGLVQPSDEERKKAFESGTEAKIAEIEYEQAKSGKIPITYFFRKWLGPFMAGVGGTLLGYAIKGCN